VHVFLSTKVHGPFVVTLLKVDEANVDTTTFGMIQLMDSSIRSLSKLAITNKDQNQVFNKDWTMPSNRNKYSTLNNEHKWEDLCIQVRNQQTYTSNNHNKIKGGPIF
jgi:hypothetical protein